MSERILVVEDEPAISDAIAYTLRSSDYDVDAVGDGETALRLPLADYDLVILDLMLPGIAGIEVCRRVRARGSVPILILTARSDEVDRVLGLEAGADDYVSKPFSMPELVSRVRAILRRRELDRHGEAAATRRAGALALDLTSQTLRVDDRLVDVTPSEFRLIVRLAEEPGRAFTRQELADAVSRGSTRPNERACDVHVKNLRRKIEPDPAHPTRLVTVRGVGYMLRS
jgi:two-component system response regulator RegX3